MASKITWFDGKLKQKVLRVAIQQTNKACLLVEHEAKRTIRDDPKTGVWYKKPGLDTWWQASAAGESPAIRFGFLVNSITHEVMPMGDKIEGRVGTNLITDQGEPLALWLERGTSGGQMAARPYLRPSLYKNQQKIAKLFDYNTLSRFF